MKTAISIPDTVFHEADAVAKRLSMTRSALYTEALRRYLETVDDTRVTQALDQVYAATDSALAPQDHRLQLDSLPREEW